MARDLNPDFENGIQQPVTELAYLVEMDLACSPLYMWTGINTLTYEGKEFLGLGHLGNISSYIESTNVQAEGMSLTMNGIPSEMISTVLSEEMQGRLTTISIALVSNRQVVGVPYTEFIGRIDVPSIFYGAQNSSITVSLESHLIDFKRRRIRKNTDVDQRIDFPNDDGKIYVISLQKAAIPWGDNSIPAPFNAITG